MPTREIIKAIKDSGNHVQILTKGGYRAERDFDLLDSNDWFGVTYTGAGNNRFLEDFNRTCEIEPYGALVEERNVSLLKAHKSGVKTWMSCEPVIKPMEIYRAIKTRDFIDIFRIGKLNYAGIDPRLKKIHDSIDWYSFGHECERLCREYGRNYYIKESLRKIMKGENKCSI